MFPVMVMFTARWCGPCRDMIPILNKMDSEYKNEFKFYTVNFDTEIRFTERFDISYLPTTLVFKGGEQMAKVTGADPKKLRELVKKYI
jgi:thioredoxin 1|uniref:Putative thioredoxin; 109829-109566 n=1 Tax=Arabidopsis thaliana TaxID=3702 RepID=Q9C922_ARATH|nr:putative thioredoxin; 109829-109566 [Arabidopsis thaliana]